MTRARVIGELRMGDSARCPWGTGNTIRLTGPAQPRTKGWRQTGIDIRGEAVFRLWL